MKLPNTVRLAIFAALLLFWNLGYAPFLNPDEGRYASASYEMAFGLNGSGSNWLIPHLDTVTRLNKPPLVYWGTALMFKLLGPSAWAGRLPQALASLGVLALIWVWASRVWDRRAAALGALVWASAVFTAAMGRVANTDMLLTGAIALASFGAFWLLEASTKRGRAYATAALGLGMGLALLAKGPVGMALPLVGMAVYALLSRSRFDSHRVPGFAIAIVVALLIGLPWYFTVELQRPGFLHDFIFSENLKRFGGGENFHNKTSPLYYLPIILGGLLPWSPFLVLAFSHRLTEGRARRSRLFLWIWALGITAFFSISHTKLVSYVLPAFPAFAMLLGAALSDWSRTPARLRTTSVAIALLLNLALVCVVTGFPKRDKVTKAWAMAPGYLLDEKTVPREDGVRWVWIISATLALQSAGWLLCLRRPSVRTLGLIGTNNAVLMMVVLLQAAGHIIAYEDGAAAMTAIAPTLLPNEKLVCFRCFLPSGIVQTGRPIVFPNFKNTSGLDVQELKNSPLFPPPRDNKEFIQWLQQPDQKAGAVIVVQSSLEPESVAEGHLTLWGRNNDFFVYGTRPKPDNFDFTMVAPGKEIRPPRPDYVPGQDDLPGPSQ